MRLLALALLLALSGSVLAEAFLAQLYARNRSSDDSFTDKYLQAVREDSDTFQFFLADKEGATTVHYYEDQDVVTIREDEVDYFVTYNDDRHLIATSKPGEYYVNILDALFNVNLALFNAKKDIGDAIGYSKENYAVYLYKESENRNDFFDIYADFIGNSSDSGDSRAINPSNIASNATVASNTFYTLGTEFQTTNTFTTDFVDTTSSSGSVSGTTGGSESEESTRESSASARSGASTTASSSSSDSAKSSSQSGSSASSSVPSSTSKPSGAGNVEAGNVGIVGLLIAVLMC